MSVLSLSLITNKPTALPDTVLAKVVIPAGFSYSTGGVAINLAAAAIADPELLGGACGPNYILPDDVDVSVQGGDGYYAEWIPGTTLQNGKLRLWQPGGSEVGAGTLGAPFTNSNCQINFKITIDPDDHQ
jgi:hypothetical protein